MPFVRPVTVHDVAGSVVTDAATVEQVRPSGEEVTVYPEIWSPPSESGAVQTTVAVPLRVELADWFPGAFGAAAGVVSEDESDETLEPTAETACTTKV